MTSKIAVIGCGWLGFPLAKSLVENGCLVHGSTTTESKFQLLRQSGITPFLVELTSEGIVGHLNECLSNCDTAIINIPPGLRKNPEDDYVKKMTFLLEEIERSSIEHLLFIGSTSVYDDTDDFPIITEDSSTSTSKTALKLLEVEALFKNHNKLKTTILRFGGLFAEDRHPARYLSGRTGMKNALAPVNLIHRKDCIKIIITILNKSIWNDTFNASTTGHPTKQSYYTSVCKRLHIAIPEFDLDSKSQGKQIDSSKLKQVLDYDFQVTIN